MLSSTSRGGGSLQASVADLRAEMGNAWPFPDEAHQMTPVSMRRTLARSHELDPRGALADTVGAYLPTTLRSLGSTRGSQSARESASRTAAAVAEAAIAAEQSRPLDAGVLVSLAKSKAWATDASRRLRRLRLPNEAGAALRKGDKVRVIAKRAGMNYLDEGVVQTVWKSSRPPAREEFVVRFPHGGRWFNRSELELVEEGDARAVEPLWQPFGPSICHATTRRRRAKGDGGSGGDGGDGAEGAEEQEQQQQRRLSGEGEQEEQEEEQEEEDDGEAKENETETETENENENEKEGPRHPSERILISDLIEGRSPLAREIEEAGRLARQQRRKVKTNGNGWLTPHDVIVLNLFNAIKEDDVERLKELLYKFSSSAVQNQLEVDITKVVNGSGLTLIQMAERRRKEKCAELLRRITTSSTTAAITTATLTGAVVGAKGMRRMMEVNHNVKLKPIKH